MASLSRTLAAALAVLAGVTAASPSGSLEPRQQTPAPTLREVFEVSQPVLGPDGPQDSWGRDRIGIAAAATEKRQEAASCQALLMEHSFASSYEKPFIGDYTPPDCEFNRVIMNFTVTAPTGQQYDRLAIMYLGDTEVWRTSTAEPGVQLGGAIWTYWKDMTHYMYFWREPQKIIFDLGNIVDENFTSPFNTVLTATFFTADEEVAQEADDGAKRFGPADLILPVSARKGASDQISAWSYPEQEAVDVISSFPRNARRAVFSVSANGQDLEEFWWSGVPQSKVDVFPANALRGYDSWREVQVFIDDHLVGVSWPFPTLFTGAILPELHRPVVGINTFDLKEHEIDITPWLPLLCDGEDHTFSLQVACLDDSGADGPQVVYVPDRWVLTGKVFVWLDEDEDSITTGDLPTVTDSDPKKLAFEYSGGEVKQNERTGQNDSLDLGLQAYRSFLVEGKITTQSGEQEVSWGQSLNFSSSTMIRSAADNIDWTILISGVEGSSGVAEYRSEYSYPLKFRIWNEIRAIDLFFAESVGSITMLQLLDHKVSGAPVFSTGIEAFNGTYAASHVVTSREGYFEEAVDLSLGIRNYQIWTDQTFNFDGESVDGGIVPLYERIVSSDFDRVSRDTETISGATVELDHVPSDGSAPLTPSFTRGDMRPLDTSSFAPGRLLWPGMRLLNPVSADEDLMAVDHER